MGIRDVICRRLASKPSGQQHPTQVQTDADETAPRVFGRFRHPKAHAQVLVDTPIENGFEGKTIYIGELYDAHPAICEMLGFEPCSLIALSRELRALGLRKMRWA